MSTKKFFQAVNIPDFRFQNDCSGIQYEDLASDCENKTISILEAINFISLKLFELSEEENKQDEIRNLSSVIADLAEIGIATNKILTTSLYLSGYKDGNHGA
ncbi:TPA: hypothetical protein JD203_08025 [Cronobacter sakazakii]|uniref:hypothetical protein n=1 Tax=Enterobacteriaceae TaxID=543 RepID=UPI0004A8BEF8|nr:MULTISPECIES: hypothetical protein [Enterobacteriaceae]EGT5204827.1 hypothetical protein [Cronobacter sakazakii]EGT5755608.1 hypothetical protein [Cronobacter sakazakii]EIH9537422.1 hypothetical protein [Escherichia coli]EJG0817016.1 hypothetical protein [Cronobacter sakazakii]EJG2179649.1 hypothetical protein [Cronobacter sakazakii]